ncbi:hypothetical protein AYO45_02625 [Gammaproteobacteria bacterium SCGC AG-212-F23]|nr:hypothetical protein AYO45_02625 [Gammaproteobacteria bacterium SCGC AG-212-F23]
MLSKAKSLFEQGKESSNKCAYAQALIYYQQSVIAFCKEYKDVATRKPLILPAYIAIDDVCSKLNPSLSSGDMYVWIIALKCMASFLAETEPNKSIKYAEKGIGLFQENKPDDIYVLAQLHYNLGHAHRYTTPVNPKECIRQLDKAETILQNSMVSECIMDRANWQYEKADILYLRQEYAKSAECALVVITILSKLTDSNLIKESLFDKIRCYQSAGNAYSMAHDYDNAMKHYTLAETLAKQIESPTARNLRDRASGLAQMGSIHNKRNDFKNMSACYLQAGSLLNNTLTQEADDFRARSIYWASVAKAFQSFSPPEMKKTSIYFQKAAKELCAPLTNTNHDVKNYKILMGFSEQSAKESTKNITENRIHSLSSQQNNIAILVAPVVKDKKSNTVRPTPGNQRDDTRKHSQPLAPLSKIDANAYFNDKKSALLAEINREMNFTDPVVFQVNETYRGKKAYASAEAAIKSTQEALSSLTVEKVTTGSMDDTQKIETIDRKIKQLSNDFAEAQMKKNAAIAQCQESLQLTSARKSRKRSDVISSKSEMSSVADTTTETTATVYSSEASSTNVASEVTSRTSAAQENIKKSDEGKSIPIDKPVSALISKKNINNPQPTSFPSPKKPNLVGSTFPGLGSVLPQEAKKNKSVTTSSPLLPMSSESKTISVNPVPPAQPPLLAVNSHLTHRGYSWFRFFMQLQRPSKDISYANQEIPAKSMRG